jgi:histidinol-phosphate aminotransferase
VVGNPTNPTSVLHRREDILALRRPGRVVVVDEAFADAIPGEPALTKTWALAGLTSIGLDVIDGHAPFVLFTVPDAQLMRKHLDVKGIAVRRCDTFVGLDGEYLRAAVRPHWPVLVNAIAESLQ